MEKNDNKLFWWNFCSVTEIICLQLKGFFAFLLPNFFRKLLNLIYKS